MIFLKKDGIKLVVDCKFLIALQNAFNSCSHFMVVWRIKETSIVFNVAKIFCGHSPSNFV